MGGTRLRRYQAWANGAAIYAALRVGYYLGFPRSVVGTVLFWLAFLTPFGAEYLLMQWLQRRANAQIPPTDWRALRWLRSALLLRDEWWESPLQIGRAWLIGGVALGACAFATYGDTGTALFVGITYPGIVLAISAWHFRNPPDDGALPPSGWYPDPGGTDAQRYWDGRQWTDTLWTPKEPPPTGPYPTE